MTDPDRNTILKEMGITQWVLRDDPGAGNAAGDEQKANEPAKEKVDEQKQRSRPFVTSSKGEKAETVQPRSEKPIEAAVQSQAVTLDSLREQVAACTACDLAKSRTNTVFGEGPDQADWLFVGEAPGQQEDRQGKPFVGRAGGLLSQMLRALDQSREQVFIANTLKCRPPNNRDPLPAELKACEPYLLKQIELVRPKVMVALGRISAQALLKSDLPLGRLRGQLHHYGPDKVPLVVTYHPAYLLRQPAEKGKVWEDLLLAHRQISD